MMQQIYLWKSFYYILFYIETYLLFFKTMPSFSLKTTEFIRIHIFHA